MANDPGKLEPPKLFRRKKASAPRAPGPLNQPLQRDASTAAQPIVAEPTTGETVPEVPVVEKTVDHGPSEAAVEEPVSEPTVVLPPPQPDPQPVPELAPEPVQPAPEPVQPVVPPQKRVRRPLSVNGHVAALIGGVVAGLLLAGLTWAAEAADNTESNRINALMLVAIFVVSVVAGTLTLRLLKVASPGTIAFLGTALVAVLAVVALGGHLDQAAGAIGVFVISAVAYPLARWVTVRYIDEAA